MKGFNEFIQSQINDTVESRRRVEITCEGTYTATGISLLNYYNDGV